MFYKINLKFLFVFPLIITLARLIGFPFNTNYLLFLILILLNVFNFNIRRFLFLLMITFIISIQVLFMGESLDYISLVYFLNFIMILFFTYNIGLKKLKLYTIENLNCIKATIIIISIINIIMFISKNGWSLVWGKMQFQSIYGFPHDACYLFITIQTYCIIAYLYSEKYKYIFKILTYMFFIFSCFTNARTPFLISIFLIGLFSYKTIKNKKVNVIFIIFMLLLIVLINVNYNFIKYENLPIISKFIRGEEIGNMTSSRDFIWQSIMDSGYKNFSFWRKIFGEGFGISFRINQMFFGEPLWSHNDIYEILVSFGLVGLIIYAYNFFKAFLLTDSKISIIVVCLVLFFNGIYTYYMFVCAIPIFILSISELSKKKGTSDEKNNVYDS